MKYLLLLLISSTLLAKNTLPDFPDMKLGLWNSVTDTGETKNKGKICIDKKTKNNLLFGSQNMLKKFCKIQYKFTKNELKTTADCNMFGMKYAMTNITKGDFKTSVVTTTKAKGNTQFLKNGNSITKSTYVGPCPKGMKPGDIQYNDGSGTKQINTNDMMKQLKGMDFLK